MPKVRSTRSWGGVPTHPVLPLVGGDMAEFVDLKRAFQSVFSRPIAFHSPLGRIAGSALSGLMLSQACYWSDNAETQKREGWFYKSQEEWETETCLTRWEQESARKQLRKRGYLEEKRQGVPARLWYRVNFEKIWSALGQSSLWENHNLVCGKTTIKNVVKPQSLSLSENTTENTTENTKEIVPVALWLSFAEMRRKIKRPMTDHAGELIRRKLIQLRDEGFDPVEVLEQSIRNSWQDVFPLRKEGASNGRESFEQQKRRREEKALGEVFSGAGKVLQRLEAPVPDTRDQQSTTRRLLGVPERSGSG
jgi:predicted transcriptional regulator